MSSKRRLRRRECTGKMIFIDRPEAEGYMRWLDSIGKLRPGSHAYPCRFGNHFHIGRGSKGLRRQRIKAWQWNMGV